MTAAIRAERSHGGELGEGVSVDRYVPRHYTLAQKHDPGQFHLGQVLVFHNKTPSVRRHEVLEIVRVDPSGPLIVRIGAATDLAVDAALAGTGIICVSACKFDPLSRGIGVQN